MRTGGRDDVMRLDFDDLSTVDMDWDDRAARGLQQYVRQVRQALGLRGECSFIHADDLASAYIALDGRLTPYPDCDVALLWDEEHGWSAAVEDLGGGDLLVVAYLGEPVLPAPAEVAEWAGRLLRGTGPRQQDRVPPVTNTDDVRRLLIAYTGPRFATTTGGF
jgi:hypothetical protein